MVGRTRAIALVVVAGLVGALLSVAPVVPVLPAEATESGFFSDGTEMRVDITAPADGSSAPGGEVSLEGTARVGGGDTVADTSVVVVIDNSNSTTDRTGVDCDGVGSTDDDMFVCEKAGVVEFITGAAEVGSVAEIALIRFSGSASLLDARPDLPGVQAFTEPGADRNGNGTSDLVDVLMPLGRSNGTRYDLPASLACSTLAGSSQPNKYVVFLSDGENASGQPVSTVLPCAGQPDVAFQTFAVGRGARCDLASGNRGSLQDVAELTGGTCTNVVDPSVLRELLDDLVRPEIVGLSASVNGGPPIDLSADVTPPLPAQGPQEVSFARLIPGLTGPVDELCVTAVGQRGDELIEVVDCVELVSNRAPVADAGEDVVVDEGGVVSVDGSASSDPDGDPLSYAWSLVGQDGPPVVLTSTSGPTLAFQAPDNGTYTFELVVSDGRESSSDRVVVTVANANPVVTAVAEPAAEGGVALVSASFTDAGFVDSHAASIDWGDGTPVEQVPVATQGTGWGTVVASHIYPSGGSFSATVTVIDADGGTSTSGAAGVGVTAPLGVWANQSGSNKGITISGSGSTITGATHSNSDLKVSGSNKAFVGPTTVVGSVQVSGSNNTFTPAVASATVTPPPVTLNLDDYRPGGRAAVDAGASFFDLSSACGNKWKPTTTLAPGLYWVPCNVQVSGSQFSAGPVTIATTGEVQVSGSSQEFFEPFIDGALFVSGKTGNNVIQVSGSGSLFSGYLHALGGEIQISGSGHTFFCGMLGGTIKISGSNTQISAADCARPARTTADPLLVPSLAVGVNQTPVEVAPGATITDDLSVTHAGATVAIAGIVGIQNLGTTPTSVNDAVLKVERFDVATGQWAVLDAPTVITTRPNPTAGVTHSAGGGFVDTDLASGAYATWAVQAAVTLSPAQVDAVLDPAVTGGVRVMADLGVDPAVPVRQLVRFSSDLAPALRAQGAGLSGVEVTLVAPDGTVTVAGPTTDPALGSVAPGASVSLTATSPVATVGAPAPTETAAAYAARLDSLDDTALSAVAFATGSAGVGRIVAPQRAATSIRRLPVLDPSLLANLTAAAGDDLGYLIGFTNRGSAEAVGIDTTANVDGEPATIDGLPTDLAPAGVIVGTIAHTIPADRPAGDLDATATFAWADPAGNTYGPVHLDTTTEVGTAARLKVSLADRLLVDADANALPSPGDTIGYTATITNTGDNPATGVTFDLPVDPNGTLEPGSVTADTGTITTGTNPGDTSITVDIGDIPASQSAEIAFAATAANPMPAGVSRLSVQATVTATAPAGTVLSDDPGQYGTANPTITQLVLAQPALEATLSDVVAIDADANGAPSPGDTLRYELHVMSVGNTPVNDTELTVTPNADTLLVVGSVEATTGTVTSGNDSGDTTITVDVGTLAPGGEADIVFETTVDEATTGTTVANQATIAATNVGAPVVSDDPDTPTVGDPTTTVLQAGDPNEPPDTGPEIGDCTLADGEAITEPTDLACAFAPRPDTEIVSWEVTVERTDGQGRRTIASGTGEPTDPIATIDPTLMANTTWVVTVAATDNTGGTSRETVGVIVEGQLKLGRYNVTYQDMAVPVGGIPIQILRTYDTLNRDIVGDFGYGWTLDVSDFQVAVHRPLGQGGWEQYQCGGGFIFVEFCFRSTRAHYVTVTWPDGRVETFDFTPRGLSSFYSAGAIAKYTGRPNTTSKLKPMAGETNLGWAGTGNLTTGVFGGGQPYDPTRFVLVAKDGTEYTLDRDQGLVEARDRNGNTVTIDDTGIHSSAGPDITWTRDIEGRIERVTGPSGNTRDYGYDPAGDLFLFSDGEGFTGEFGYEDGTHLLTSLPTAGAGPVHRVEYGPDGRVSRVVDGDGLATDVEIDLDERAEIRRGPDPRSTVVERFNERGDLERIDEIAEGQTLTTRFEHDEQGRVTRSEDPLHRVATATYDDDGNVVRSQDASGVVSEWAYNDYSQPVSYAVGGQVEATWSYDGRGNVVTNGRPGGAATTYQVDGRGTTTRAVESSGREWTVQRDANGRPARIDGPDGTSVFQFDAGGRLVSMRDELDQTVSYEWDDNDRLVGLIRPGSQRDTWVYDSAGNVVSERNGNRPETVNLWSPGGRMLSTTNREGETTSFGYDEAGRLESASYPQGQRRWTYDGYGRPTAAFSPGAALSFQWNEAGDPVSETMALADGFSASLQYTLDGAGRVTRLQGPAGASTTYAFDGSGRLATASDTSAGTFSFQHLPGSDLMSTLTRPNGTTDTLVYDNADRLLGRVTTNSVGDVVDEVGVTYNAVGHREEVTDHLGVHRYGYDRTGRLLTADHPDASPIADEVYSWDADGNRTSAGYPAILEELDDGRLHSDGTFSYTWDAEGRLLAKTPIGGGAPTTYGWDALDNLLWVDDPSVGRIDLTYDAYGRLVESDGPTGSVQQLWNDGNIYATWNDGLASSRLVAGTGLSNYLAEVDNLSTTVSYVVADEVGTWTGMLDGSGSITYSDPLDSFGVGPSGQPISTPWAGHFATGTGLYQARARWIDPTVGRFLSEDPIEGTNPHSYALGNPIDNYDPTGAITITGYASKLKENQKKTAAQHRQGCATSSQLTSGVYGLYQTGSDVPFYIGRTKNFRARELAHQARFGDDVTLTPLARTGDYKTMRGLEEFFIDAWLDYLGELSNEIGGVSAKNKSKDSYFKAAERFLKRCGSPK